MRKAVLAEKKDLQSHCLKEPEYGAWLRAATRRYTGEGFEAHKQTSHDTSVDHTSGGQTESNADKANLKFIELPPESQIVSREPLIPTLTDPPI